MIQIKGKYNEAKVFTNHLEETAAEQILELCNEEFTKNSIIRIMPDTHAGAGCTIGTTMTIMDKVVPNLVGVDIGCGVHVTRLKDKNIQLSKLDDVIHEKVPSGFRVRKAPHEFHKKIDLSQLKCKREIHMERGILSIGTLGGGNHFIEINADEEGQLYLVIHTGSRHVGKQVAEYYQQKAITELKKKHGKDNNYTPTNSEKLNTGLAYLMGESLQDYLNDMVLVQSYGDMNRKAIADVIIKNMKLEAVEEFTTVHNYIDMQQMILRKGAVSAQKGEKLIIPINMRDGSILAIGKGNKDWNYSAPHGAGRLMGRKQAKKALSMEDYKRSMEGVYSSTISKATLDEAPHAYKPMEEIISNMKDTVEIDRRIKPLYNFKAAGD